MMLLLQLMGLMACRRGAFVLSAPALLLLGAALANLVLDDTPGDTAEPLEETTDDASVVAHAMRPTF
jgi:hypothetical protein